MAIENFTTYTEVDVNNKLTVTASKAEAVDADRDEDVYLYKDKTADHFDALDIDFEVYLNSAALNGSLSGMAITNTVATLAGLAGTDVSVVLRRPDVAIWRIYLWRGIDLASDFYDCNTDTPYYCTLERVAGNDGCSLKIYSDSARTNLLDTLTVTGFGTVKWRYVYGFINFNDATGGKDFDGYVQNLDLKEVVVGRSFGYIIG